MTTQKKSLLTRFFVLIVTGVLCLVIDHWAADNYDLYRYFLEMGIVAMGLFAFMADEFSGRLKAGPVYKATLSEASAQPFVQVLLTFYLLIVMAVTIYVYLGGVSAQLFQITPVNLYLAFAPVFCILFLGKYVVEKDHSD